MAVVSSCCEMLLVKSRNERNPYPLLPAVRPGTQGTARINWRKVGMTSSHHNPTTRATHVLQWRIQRSDLARASGPPKCVVVGWSLPLDSMKSESLVIVIRMLR